jgi:hypothetical protein
MSVLMHVPLSHSGCRDSLAVGHMYRDEGLPDAGGRLSARAGRDVPELL